MLRKVALVTALFVLALVPAVEARAATLTLSPTSGSVGATVAASGTGYKGNRGYSIRFGTTQVKTGTTSKTGAFSTTFSVPSGYSGATTVSAATNTTRVGTATFTVTTTPPPPPPSGLPGPDNTGVPPGTTLTSSAGITVRTAGAVIDGVNAPWVDVQAPNVTIRNSDLGQGTQDIVVINRSTNLLIVDSTIRASRGTGVMFDNFTALRLDVSGADNGFNVGNNTTVQDSWIHDLSTAADAHTDGIQFSGGEGNIVIRHNTVDPVPGTTGATSGVNIYAGPDPQDHDVRVEDNYIDGTGASAALYCPRHPADRIYVNNNRMRRGVFGYYTDSCDVPTTATTFDGNVDDLTGAHIAPGA